ncbi:zinc finger protein 250-like isoform X2 [Aricia agestis]|uniref:zinc finger protein 250-like isoform X2 n=1 Tax=Aricia agestis TaxID=91739 RepID=UPI001C207AF9|nr:zinc finger protein 250-like isoform X2 [Aricia agestis]
MLKLTCCYLCLSVNKRPFNVYKTDLQYIYEKLADTKVRDGECWMCYICRTRLLQCLRLQQLAVKTKGLADGAWEEKIKISGPFKSLVELSIHKETLINEPSLIKPEPDKKGLRAGLEEDKTQENAKYVSTDTCHIEFEGPILPNDTTPCAKLQGIGHVKIKQEIEDLGIEHDETQEYKNYAATDTFHIEFEDPLLVKSKVSRTLVDDGKQNNARHESDITPCAKQAIEHVEIKQEIEDLGMGVIEQHQNVSEAQASGRKTLSREEELELKRRRNRERQRAYYHRWKDLKKKEKKIKKKEPKSNAERQKEFRRRRKIQKLGGIEENLVQCGPVENIVHVTIQEDHIHSQQLINVQHTECITPEVILQRSTEIPRDGFVQDKTQENSKLAIDTCHIEFEGPLLPNDGGSNQDNARPKSDNTPIQQAIEHVEIKLEVEDLGVEENEQATNVSEEQAYISEAQASGHKTLPSDICWEPVTSTSQLQRHSDKRFSCNICSKEYSQKHNLVKHILTHGDYKPFSCNVCSKRFYQKENLDTHMRIHGGEKTVFKCDVCEKTFAHKRTLDNHKETHSTERKFSCEVCFKEFFLKRVLKAHMRTHTDEKQFSCEVCDKKFSVRDYMLKHMKTHSGEKPYTCHICQKPFSEKGTLNAHIYTHTGDKPFDCNLCSKKFSLKSTLKSHILVHIGEKPFACTYCGTKFREQKSLNRHMKKHLNSEKSFICDMCSRTFASKSTLKSHMLVHVGDKPYTCDTCGNKFREQKALNRHIKTHIGELVPIEKPFSCGTCGNRYREQKALNRHLQSHADEIMKLEIT